MNRGSQCFLVKRATHGLMWSVSNRFSRIVVSYTTVSFFCQVITLWIIEPQYTKMIYLQMIYHQALQFVATLPTSFISVSIFLVFSIHFCQFTTIVGPQWTYTKPYHLLLPLAVSSISPHHLSLSKMFLSSFASSSPIGSQTLN